MSCDLITDDLHSGRLVRLFAQRVLSPYRFHLLRPPEAEARPAVKAFCDWLRAEVQAAELEMSASPPS